MNAKLSRGPIKRCSEHGSCFQQCNLIRFTGDSQRDNVSAAVVQRFVASNTRGARRLAKQATQRFRVVIRGDPEVYACPALTHSDLPKNLTVPLNALQLQVSAISNPSDELLISQIVTEIQ